MTDKFAKLREIYDMINTLLGKHKSKIDVVHNRLKDIFVDFEDSEI